MKRKDVEHLKWIYERMHRVHKENPNVDYMMRFREILKEQDLGTSKEDKRLREEMDAWT